MAAAVAFSMARVPAGTGAGKTEIRHGPGWPGSAGSCTGAWGRRRDALFEVCDAVLCKQDRVDMLELSLKPECRRGHGAVYDAVVCWMAWRIAAAGHAGRVTNVPARFLGIAAFPWVNPKRWLIGVAAVATFPDQRADGDRGHAIIFAILFTLAALPSCFPGWRSAPQSRASSARHVPAAS